MAQQPLEINPIYGNRLPRHRARVALATGLTIAALIGSQTLAVLDRTVSAKPVQIGPPDATPTLANTPNKPGKKPKASMTPVPSLSTPAGPSLNISDGGGVKPAAGQPAPFTLSSR